MLNLFRLLRLNVISANSLRKLIGYSVLEIILVVAGILIAMNIDDWNEKKKDLERETKWLADLHRDVTEDINNIDNQIIMYKKDSVEILQAIPLMQNLHLSKSPINDFIKIMKLNHILWNDLTTITYTFEEIKNEGGIAKMTDISLKNKMKEYYSTAAKFSKYVSETNDMTEYMRWMNLDINSTNTLRFKIKQGWNKNTMDTSWLSLPNSASYNALQLSIQDGRFHVNYKLSSYILVLKKAKELKDVLEKELKAREVSLNSDSLNQAIPKDSVQ